MNKLSQLRHPSAEQLQEFILGKLSDAASDGIESHLHACEQCNQLLDGISVDDSFVSLIRGQNGEFYKNSDDYRPLQIKGYEIIEELGRGGMGVVYKALDLRLKRKVALKVILNSGEHAGPEQRERLRLEAETIARLQHPGIVQIYEIGEHQGHLYIALELLGAESLQSIMNGATHDARWSAALIRQLAEIIDYSHRSGIIHRDLKPGNILFNPQTDAPIPSLSQFQTPGKNLPAVKITDFGLAKYLDPDSKVTRTGLMLGTPSYMAPEQIPGSGGVVSHQSDIYALGVILYQLLTGRLPFRSDNIMQALEMLRHDDPVAPRQVNRTIPRDLETICLKCLMKQPAERYASAQALAEDLALFLQNEPIRAKPLSLLQRAMRWARRKPVLASGYAVIFLLYGFHLLLMLVLKIPQHQGIVHDIATVLAISLMLLFFSVEKMLGSERWRRLGQYGGNGAVTVLLTFSFMFALTDFAVRYVPVNCYIYTILGAALTLPRPRMIWFQALLSSVCYLSVVAYIYWFRPDLPVSVTQSARFVIDLVFVAILTHLLVHRIAPANAV